MTYVSDLRDLRRRCFKSSQSAATSHRHPVPPRIDLAGRVFGRWTVVGFAESRLIWSGKRRPFWLCRCECGTERVVDASNLREGGSGSCGCQNQLGIRSTRHGYARPGRKAPEYIVWMAMKMRCSNPNHPFFYCYGGRGIRVCDRWLHSFENFLADVGPRPVGGRYSIDRINNDGNYEPGNVRWATDIQQANNRRKSKMDAA